MSDWISPILRHLEQLLATVPTTPSYTDIARILSESLSLLPTETGTAALGGDSRELGKLKQKLHITTQLISRSSLPLPESLASSVHRAFFQVFNEVTWLIETDLVERNLCAADESKCVSLLHLLYAFVPTLARIAKGDAATTTTTTTTTIGSIESESSSGEATIMKQLGAELAEVALWRRGALRFMLTSVAVQEKRVRVGRLVEDVRQGASDLEAVLVQRDGTRDAHIQPGDQLVYGQGGKDVEEMVRDKIYSDTHLLSLAYAAELYYYGWKYADPIDPTTKQEFRSKAVELFEKYVRVVSGPMKGAGWSTDKADEILKELRRQRTKAS